MLFCAVFPLGLAFPCGGGGDVADEGATEAERGEDGNEEPSTDDHTRARGPSVTVGGYTPTARDSIETGGGDHKEHEIEMV